MGKAIILVAGVSGVGKTTLCQRLAAVEPDIHHLIASSFFDGQHAADQVALVARIRATAEELGGASLVDGHLIVGGHKVPLEAVAALAPSAILVVIGRPADILSRRARDITRARPAVTEDAVEGAQGAEVQWARELALAVGVPFAAVDSQDSHGFRAEVLHLAGTGCPQGDSGSLNRYSARPGT